MHVMNNAKQKLTAFTYTSWCKFVSFAAKWRKLPCNEGEIALEAASKLCLRFDDLPDSATSSVDFAETARSSDSYLPIPAYCKFHRDCYNRFCNILMLGREEKRQNIRDEQEIASETDQEYNEKKKEVLSQIENNKIEAVALYTLALLLARWRSNETLPLCLLCRKIVPKKAFGLGHLIPHSILKQCELKYFADVKQGKEFGVSKMGYRAFCSECEGKFSKAGEVHLNPKFFKPFYDNQNDAIKVNVRDNGKPWLYFCLISIVWRCMCFSPGAKDMFHNPLEYLRSFLLNYTREEPGDEVDPKAGHDHDIDSKVTLFVFAPNSKLDIRLSNPLDKTYKMFFDKMCAAEFQHGPNLTAAWVFMGPIHILMVYNSTGRDWPGPFGLSKEDLEQAKQFCIIKSTDINISIKNKQERFFPLSMYPTIVSIGENIVSETVRVHPSKTTATDSTLPPVQVTKLLLLPKCVGYTGGKFSIPHFYKGIFCYIENRVKIVGALRGKDEKIIFVACEGAIKYKEDDHPKSGPLAMALNVHDNGKFSYLKGVHIPSKDKCNGQDLSKIPYQQDIEKLMDRLIKEGTAKWSML